MRVHPVDLAVAQIPVLLNDFFRQRHRRSDARLSVFLCGRKPKESHSDLRKQVERLLKKRMGCDAFLGEDIKDLKYGPTLDQSHLTIEVREARQSDLVIMFLGSPGTVSEVTAFAMNEAIRPKVVVFNDVRYRNEESFIRLGPLKLLRKDQVIYYDVADETPSEELVKHLDMIVARAHFSRAKAGTAFSPGLNFESWVALCLILVSYPVRYESLLALYSWEERMLREALKPLFSSAYIERREGKYLPKTSLNDTPMLAAFAKDLSSTRMALLGKRLRDSNAVADYRMLV